MSMSFTVSGGRISLLRRGAESIQAEDYVTWPVNALGQCKWEQISHDAAVARRTPLNAPSFYPC